MTIATLETKGLDKSFGGLRVTRDLSLKVEQGARHALIGPNGAGKTTVINLLTGVLKPNGGTILLEGNDITDLAVHTRVNRQIGDVVALEQDRPSIRLQHAGQEIDDGGLARAVRPDQGVAGALLHLQRQIT